MAEFRNPGDSWRVPVNGQRVRYVRLWAEGEHSDCKITLWKFLVYGKLPRLRKTTMLKFLRFVSQERRPCCGRADAGLYAES